MVGQKCLHDLVNSLIVLCEIPAISCSLAFTMTHTMKYAGAATAECRQRVDT